eukprot:1032080-Pelagomonas_calceolata.AAC.1
MERLNKRAPGWGQGHKALFCMHVVIPAVKKLLSRPWLKDKSFNGLFAVVSMHKRVRLHDLCVCVCVCGCVCVHATIKGKNTRKAVKEGQALSVDQDSRAQARKIAQPTKARIGPPSIYGTVGGYIGPPCDVNAPPALISTLELPRGI